MYSVFLAEDEIVVREGIKRLVSWEEYGFTFAGEAPDGELAWSAIQKQKPDIVITDIKMPFMDGLELSRFIKKNLPCTIVVILSGYDDFLYAQEAISIGVSQYLLKPLAKDQLVDVLLEVKKKKDEEQAQTQYNIQFAGEVQKYLSSSRRDFFDMLISGGVAVPSLLERAQRLGLDVTAEQYNIVLFLLEKNLPGPELPAQDNASDLPAAVQPEATVPDEISRAFSDSRHFIMFSAGMGVTVFLIKADDGDIMRYTEDCVNTLNQICLPLADKIYHVIITGEPVTRLSALGKCYKAARKALFYRKTLEPALSSGQMPLDFNPDEMDANKMDSRLVEKFLINGLQEDIHSFVQDYFDGFGPKTMESILFRHYVVLNMHFAVTAFAKKMEWDMAARDSEIEKKKLAEAMASLNGVKEYTTRLLSNALSARELAATNRYREMLRVVIAYMMENYSNPNMNLNAAARIANMAPSYFSAVFSQQTGKTFVERLTELRMEKARELLRCTTDSSSEISFKVGYNDPHYFSFLFKKITGCSPREYRSGKKEG
ncbi:MAG: response regulator [Clostridiales bacterium]|jgi:two-component system response regulator YesN|nr:response regulator [Clostridiales bacterium]